MNCTKLFNPLHELLTIRTPDAGHIINTLWQVRQIRSICLLKRISENLKWVRLCQTQVRYSRAQYWAALNNFVIFHQLQYNAPYFCVTWTRCCFGLSLSNLSNYWCSQMFHYYYLGSQMCRETETITFPNAKVHTSTNFPGDSTNIVFTKRFTKLKIQVLVKPGDSNMW